MSNKTTLWQKIEKLEMSVIQDPPAEVAKVCQELGKVDFTARALGLACRYRGLDMVKVLVEYGATFTFDPEKIKPAFRHSQLVYLDWLYGDENYSLGLLGEEKRRETYELNNIGKSHCGISLISLDERLKILDCFYRNAENIGFAPDEFLFYAYFALEWEMVTYLKDKGVRVSERLVKTVTEGGNNDCWMNYAWITGHLPDEQFVRVMSAVIAECGGKKLHFTDLFWHYNEKRFENPTFFKFLLENFDQSKMNKTKLLKKFIDLSGVECLTFCAENGWLKTLRKCEEMIRYASENGKTECAAWLLEFQNRNFDLAFERAKAEKRKERELTADPHSVTELKKIWKYEKREDGTIIITGYKGNRTEIVVPEKIGKDTVAAVGEYAFSPNALRISEEQALTRCRITKIVLPESVKTIGKFAFGGFGVCRAVSGYFNVFSDLREVILPDDLDIFSDKQAAESAPPIFNNCRGLTVKIPHKLAAELYCRRLGYKFEFK